MSAFIRRLGLAAAATLLAASTAAASGFSVEPEALFLKFSESNFPVAVEADSLATIEDGELIDVDHDYDFGFRLGISYAWEGWWDITARWTHVDSTDRATATDDRGFLRSPLIHPAYSFFGIDDFERVDAQQDLDLDYFDITAGKTWNCDNGGRIKLFFGARLSWFDQDTGVVNYRSDTVWEITETWLDWKGWGPIVGFEGHVPLGMDSGWSFFGSAAGSMQFGDSDGEYFDVYVPDSTMKAATEMVLFGYEDKESATVTVLEARAGFAWAKEFDSTTFSLRFGYEYQTWDGLATTNSLYEDAQDEVDLRTDGDFDLHGFFFQVAWLF